MEEHKHRWQINVDVPYDLTASCDCGSIVHKDAIEKILNRTPSDEVVKLREELEKAMRVIQNDCENETEATRIAVARFPTLEGDSDAVPGIVEIVKRYEVEVESAARRITFLESLRSRLQSSESAREKAEERVTIAKGLMTLLVGQFVHRTEIRPESRHLIEPAAVCDKCSGRVFGGHNHGCIIGEIDAFLKSLDIPKEQTL